MRAGDKSLKKNSATKIHGQGKVEFCHRDGSTNLSHLYQRDPVRILFPNFSADEIKQGVIVTTSGGMVGGDTISLDLTFGEKTSAMVMAQAAEKIYGSSRYDSFINVDLKAKSMAWAEYLPQETILFDGARLNRTTRIEAATGAQILAGEIIVFGRQGRGESFTSGFLRDAWEVKRDQKLIWADTLLLKNNVSKVINHPTCFDGASVVATVILICDDVESYVGEAQRVLRDNCTTIRAGASLINGVLVARFIGKDALQLRKSFSLLWQSLRHSVAALPKSMPRLWQI